MYFFYILGTIKETTLCLRKWRSKSDEKGKTLLINNGCLSAVRRRGGGLPLFENFSKTKVLF